MHIAYITDDFGAKPTKRRMIYFRLPLEYKGNKQSWIAGMINYESPLVFVGLKLLSLFTLRRVIDSRLRPLHPSLDGFQLQRPPLMTFQFLTLLDKIEFIKFKLILLLHGFANIVIQDMLPHTVPDVHLICIAKGQTLVRIITLHAALNWNGRGGLWHHKNILTQTIVT